MQCGGVKSAERRGKECRLVGLKVKSRRVKVQSGGVKSAEWRGKECRVEG